MQADPQTVRSGGGAEDNHNERLEFVPGIQEAFFHRSEIHPGRMRMWFGMSVPFANEMQPCLEPGIDNPLLGSIARPESETPALIRTLRFGRFFNADRLRGNPREQHASRFRVSILQLPVSAHGRQRVRA